MRDLIKNISKGKLYCSEKMKTIEEALNEEKIYSKSVIAKLVEANKVIGNENEFQIALQSLLRSVEPFDIQKFQALVQDYLTKSKEV